MSLAAAQHDGRPSPPWIEASKKVIASDPNSIIAYGSIQAPTGLAPLTSHASLWPHFQAGILSGQTLPRAGLDSQEHLASAALKAALMGTTSQRDPTKQACCPTDRRRYKGTAFLPRQFLLTASPPALGVTVKHGRQGFQTPHPRLDIAVYVSLAQQANQDGRARPLHRSGHSFGSCTASCVGLRQTLTFYSAKDRWSKACRRARYSAAYSAGQLGAEACWSLRLTFGVTSNLRIL
jgi:hypothetical protein